MSEVGLGSSSRPQQMTSPDSPRSPLVDHLTPVRWLKFLNIHFKVDQMQDVGGLFQYGLVSVANQQSPTPDVQRNQLLRNVLPEFHFYTIVFLLFFFH